jgi:hypothetical protein
MYHAPVLYPTPAHLSLRSRASQVLINTFPTLFITSLSDFGLLMPTRPVTAHFGPPRSGVSGQETLCQVSAHYLSSPLLSLKCLVFSPAVPPPAFHQAPPVCKTSETRNTTSRTFLSWLRHTHQSALSIPFSRPQPEDSHKLDPRILTSQCPL